MQEHATSICRDMWKIDDTIWLVEQFVHSKGEKSCLNSQHSSRSEEYQIRNIHIEWKLSSAYKSSFSMDFSLAASEGPHSQLWMWMYDWCDSSIEIIDENIFFSCYSCIVRTTPQPLLPHFITCPRLNSLVLVLTVYKYYLRTSDSDMWQNVYEEERKVWQILVLNVSCGIVQCPCHCCYKHKLTYIAPLLFMS